MNPKSTVDESHRLKHSPETKAVSLGVCVLVLFGTFPWRGCGRLHQFEEGTGASSGASSTQWCYDIIFRLQPPPAQSREI